MQRVRCSRSRRSRRSLVRAFVTAGLLAGSSAVLSLVSGVGVGAAAATPGSPGTPQAPTVVYAEDFENTGLTPVLLNAYTGTSGMTYTADAGWLTGCNGAIVALNSPAGNNAAAGCSSNSDYAQVRSLAQALGNFRDPTTANANHAVTAYTENSPGANNVQFKTSAPISLTGTNRFITFSVDAAQTNCFVGHAAFKFYLLDGTTEVPTFTTPIDPCGSNTTGTNIDTFSSNKAVLFSGSSLGIVMRNGQGSGTGNDAAFDNIRVLDATPQLDKSFSPTSVPQGGTSTLTFTVTNTSDLAEKAGWSFQDALPTGLTIADNAASTTCTNGNVTAASGSGSVGVTGDLSAGQASCTVAVHVTSSDVASYTNGPANVTETGLNAPGTADVAFTPVVDLAVSKTASVNPYVPGGPLTYTVAVTNAGPSDATGATVMDPLPAALTGAGFTWTCVASAGGTCTAAGAGDIIDTVTVPAGGTVTYLVTGTVPSGSTGSVANTATVTPPDGTTDPDCTPNCTSTVTTPAEIHTGLSVTKSASPDPYIPGSALTYTVTVANAGPSDAVGTAVSDPLPAELSAAGFTWTCAGTGGSTCTATGSGDITDTANVIAGESVVYTVTGTVPAGLLGTLDNTATVTPPTDAVDPECSPTCTDSVSSPAEPHTALTVTKVADPDPYVPGEALTYTVTVSNAGPSDAVGVDVSDPLPAALSGAGFGWSCSATVGSSCTGAGVGDISDTVTVLVGGELTYTVVGTVPSGVQADLINTATVTPPPGAVDPNCTPNCASTITTPAEPHTALSVTKTVSARPYVPGTALSYTVVVSNAGPSDAIDALVADPLPSALSDAGFSWTCTASAGSSCTESDSGDITDVVTVAAGGTLVYTVTGTVPPGFQSTLSNTVTVTPPAGAVDAGCAPDCSSTVATRAQPHTALSIAKTADPARYTPGESITYTITVRNAGPSDAVGAAVSDPLPAALSGAGFTWTCSGSTGSECPASGTGDIAATVTVVADGSVVFTLTGTVPADVTGDLVNRATVTPPPGAVDAIGTDGASASIISHRSSGALAQTGTDLATFGGSALLLLLAGFAMLIAGRRRRT